MHGEGHRHRLRRAQQPQQQRQQLPEVIDIEIIDRQPVAYPAEEVVSFQGFTGRETPGPIRFRPEPERSHSRGCPERARRCRGHHEPTAAAAAGSIRSCRGTRAGAATSSLSPGLPSRLIVEAEPPRCPPCRRQKTTRLSKTTAGAWRC